MHVDTKEVAVVKTQTTKAANAATALVITDQASYDQGSSLLGQIKAAQKAVKERKDEILKPLLEATASVRELFAPIEAAAKEAEATIKGKQIAYITEQERKAEAERAKIAKKVEEGKMKFDTGAKKLAAIEAPITQSEGKHGKTTVRTVLMVKIVEHKKVPAQYWQAPAVQAAIVDALRRAVEADARAAHKAGSTIPGVVVEEVKTIAASNSKEHFY